MGVFLEGTRTLGRVLRARSGFVRLMREVPEAQVVLCSVQGTSDFVRFPARPRIEVAFFPPATELSDLAIEPAEVSAQLLAEIRTRVPIPRLKDPVT